MKTEREKMLAGELYDAYDAELLSDLNAVKVLCQQYNNLLPTDFAARNKMLRDMLGQADEDTFINQPFYCDYGKHIRVGKRFFANFGLTILDEAYVTVGDDCFMGPHVQIYCACHSTNPQERNTRKEWAKPVTIGNSVWIGGNVTILPGVTIGDNCTIGAGSVVTHDIPANSIAVGNPCKVIKSIKQ
jgi:maltose O-acetyltransferase